MKQDRVTSNHGKVVNIYIVYEMSKNINFNDYPTLENCLFGAVKYNINNPDAKLFVRNFVPRYDETRYTEWIETCKCKCRLDASVCNKQQRWNDDKCRCECKELIDKGVCDKGSI